MKVSQMWAARRESTTERPLNLIRSFSLLSLICIVLISLTSAWMLSRFLSSHLLQRDAVVTMQFVQSIMDTMDPNQYFPKEQQDTDHMTYADFFRQKQDTWITAAFEDFFNRLALMPEVKRANAYASDETIIWSTTPKLIGHRFTDNRELKQALTGQISAKTGTVKQNEKAEHVGLGKTLQSFSESYIPIWNASRDTVIGVVEVYKVPDALFQAIARGRRLVWASALLGGLFLYAVLFGIVYRAARVIRQQGQQLVQSETLATIGEMASAMVHNIRNPLASIRSSAEIIYEEEEALAVQPQSEDIMTEVDRLESWLRDLLTYAHPLEPTLTSVQLSNLVHDVVSQVTSRLDQQKIQLQLEISHQLPALHADAPLLKQALYSIIMNALDAMPQGGTLTIKVAPHASRRQIELQIKDSGQGLASHHTTQVFRPFFTTKQRSLGVGLSFAKRIVERHGGRITLQSEEGRGVTAILTLPQGQ